MHCRYLSHLNETINNKPLNLLGVIAINTVPFIKALPSHIGTKASILICHEEAN